MNRDYILGNKSAWEETLERNPDFGVDNWKILKEETFPFLYEDLVDEIKRYDLKEKNVLQLCCNNGREISSITKGTKAAYGLGIDIAENFIKQGKENAEKAGINCEFIATDVLEIQEELIDKFDAVFFIIGANCWFEDLAELYAVAAKYLRHDGLLFIFEIHSCSDMLLMPQDSGYDKNEPLKIGWSYFRKEPFLDDNGMGYISGAVEQSKVFTSFSHTMSDVINGVVENGLKILKLQEYDYDTGANFPHLSGKGFPLTYLLVAQKE